MGGMTSSTPERLDLLDALRGFALMGLFLVHSVELYELYWLDPKPSAVHDWVFGIFAGKAFALFALCFGVSFSLIMASAAARGEDSRWRFAWRLAILLVIGLLHGLVYRGDILQILALLGFVLLPLDRIASRRVLLALALLLLAQLPLVLRASAALDGAAWANAAPRFWADAALPTVATGTLRDVLAVNMVDGQLAKWWFYVETGRIVQILGLFVCGLLLGRSGFFADPERLRRPRRMGLAVAIVATVALYWGGPAIVAAVPSADGATMARQNVQWLVESWSALAQMAIQLLLFVELWQIGADRLLRAFAPAGRMTLTLYVGQSLLFVPIYYGFGLGLYDDLNQAQALMIGIAAFALQLLFARLWFGAFLYGPLEWLWRALTRTTTNVQFRRRTA
jgi:uncharacterized protein